MTRSRTIEELLPFYVNGTLSTDEIEQVEKVLEQNPALKDDVSFLKQLRAGMRDMEHENSPGELGLRRLQKALAKENLRNDPVARAESKITKEQNLGFWRLAAVAACLLLLVQSVLVYRSGRDTTLTAAGGTVAAAESAAFSVTFRPGATEADIRALLVDLNIRIVNGPSALGVYHLSGGDDPDRVYAELQARTDVVETVQRETP